MLRGRKLARQRLLSHAAGEARRLARQHAMPEPDALALRLGAEGGGWPPGYGQRAPPPPEPGQRPVLHARPPSAGRS